METQRLRGGGILHASPPGVGNVASQLAEAQDMSVAPTPTHWRSRNVMQHVLDDGSMESASMNENEGQERWQPGGSSRTPSRASEARSGIRRRKTLQKSWIGRPKHQTSLLDASKHAQVLVGALEAAQTQQQDIYQMVREQVQEHLAEELSNWKAEQQVHEGIYLERITNLELEVSKLRTELQISVPSLIVGSSLPLFWGSYCYHAAKERFPVFIRVVDAGYTNTGATMILLEKGTLGSMLLPNYKDLLVTAARQADPAVISVELPEQWYRVKVHGVPMKHYLTCGLALACEEIELGTEYQLKRNPTWLRSSKELHNSNQKGSTIVITVSSLEEARKLLINGIRFGGSRYKTEQYWETGADTVCPRCSQLGHRSFKAYGDHPPCCFICAGPHEGTEHVCRVVDCPAKPGTICQHIPAKCGTCGGPHPATAGNCPAKRAARKELRKRTTESKNISPPVESSRRSTSVEPAIPSSPGFTFTVVN
ncbi:hypothetical protein SI65_04142 [Aspergillus cristatus]|uniref:Uncharacterized protein n=1 Tax=Aspergillus cristatus TaxID=573508 RepID=A0A1E3BJH1_ASPCR|nr:hypothetical protein SI65_04142 [Aspergillus cristatus]